MIKERHIHPIYDRKGNPEWKSVMTAPDDSVGVMSMVPDRVIPVIFVPGVMGSNLTSTLDDTAHWRLDSTSTMFTWFSKGAAERKRLLEPTAMVLDNQGAIPQGTAQHDEELRRRGWGEVGAMSYGTFLVWLENALNDFHNWQDGPREDLIAQTLGALKGESPLKREDVALSYKYRFPVHACGYNWLDDNAKSAEHLKLRINDIIKRYRREKKKCEKVILVTHSMGGLVARHCSEVLGMSDAILGVVHGVMPAIGAATVYRRFKAGTEGSWLVAKVLGDNAAEMTAVLASAPGPLQLLPTPEYGNGWLRIKDGYTIHSFPKNGDPYNEIYTVRGKWWSMCEDRLINPLIEESNPHLKREKVDREWREFSKLIHESVQLFHAEICGKYHFNTHAFFGRDKAHRAYGNVTWRGFDDHIDEPLRHGRDVDALSARPLLLGGIRTQRHVHAKVGGESWQVIRQRYVISEPDEEGDGTVPHRSGAAPLQHERVKSVLRVTVSHEPAYTDSDLARRFTLRAIVQIAQKIQKTSLRYD